MKQFAHVRYGPPGQQELRDAPAPVPSEGEVLVRVRAASINPVDYYGMNGLPLPLRRDGLLRPRHPTLGNDLAGVVESVGASVAGVRAGDSVLGWSIGSFAELAVAPEDHLVPIPSGVSFEAAAAIPIAGTTALQGLRDRAQLKPGEKVLINGASGGVGTFAVQLAVALGGDVSAVCSSANVDQARALGARRVFDYTREDFTTSGERYDVILDSQLNHPFSHYRRILAPGRRITMVGAGGGPPGRQIRKLLGALLKSRIVGPRVKMFIAQMNRPDLVFLAQLCAEGKLRPVVERSYPLDRIADGLEYWHTGHARGKIVVTM